MKRGTVPFKVNTKWVHFLVLIMVVAASFTLLSAFQEPGFEYRGLRCIGYFLNGSLYGGQPECEQPPMSYIVGAVLSAIPFFGIQSLSNILLIILNALCLHIILSLVKAQRLEVKAAVILLYVLTILPLSTGSLSTILAACFIMLAVYVYLTFQGARALMAASCLCCLALLSKVTVLSVFPGLLLAFALTYVSFSVDKPGGNRVFYVKTPLFKDMFFLLLPLMVILYMVWMVYPNLIYYALLSHTYTVGMGYSEALYKLAATNPIGDGNLFVFYFLMLMAVAYYYFYRDSLAIIYVGSSIMTFISLYRIGNAAAPDMFGSYYVIFPLLFLVTIAGRYLNQISNQRTLMRMSLLFALAVIFLGQYHIYGMPTLKAIVNAHVGDYQNMSSEVSILREKVDGVYSVLPKNTGRVLVDQTMYDVIRERSPSINMTLVDNRNNPPEEYRYYDVAYTLGLMYYNISKKHYFGTNALEENLARQIDTRVYDMIFVGPQSQDSQIMYALRNTSNTSQLYCQIFLPLFGTDKNGRHWTTLIFKDMENCEILIVNAQRYYNTVFDDVCGIDESMASLMLAIFDLNRQREGDNGLGPSLLNRTCSSKVDLVDRFNRAETDSWLNVPFLAGVAVAWMAIRIRPSVKKNKGRRYLCIRWG